MDIRPELYRRVLGHLPTGVTVLTARGDEGPIGMAANSVTSLSLDPALILFCPARSSSTWPDLRAAGRLCVNVLAEHHEPLSRQFAGKGDRFNGVGWHERIGGPGLDEAVAWIDVELETEYDGGDHTIAVARVLGLEAAEEAVPLIFFRGRYGNLAAARESA
ncbi:flavin reductase family protein [Nocardia miyunensis]|uniref:flavin reductase family protein n=1 Tax=Nocardia miyunensis TaxID=282684 RepID=UPI0008352A80|nr:flavin reductase family protein [Nocardia miyunensis]